MQQLHKMSQISMYRFVMPTTYFLSEKRNLLMICIIVIYFSIFYSFTFLYIFKKHHNMCICLNMTVGEWSSDPQSGAILPSRGHTVMADDIFGCHHWGVLMAQMLNILQCTQESTSPPNTLQVIFQSKMSIALNLRNPGIEKRKKKDKHETVNNQLFP